ncbi:tyrosine-type recombinase/integrase [Rhizorhapis suberifaciens]|uniref:Integrase n=1 Tax=Rhizorhapis suberifaciens TaxID=13656 RepID=A0A840HQF4_9SPHN|nr:site-specific integrase [Rhizorhapis suberifaciens]MBB4639828.1 integrase [Rhizorhapis suberifaciens]
MKKALTAKTLDALKGKEKRYDVHDLHCPGLSVRVSENGRKVFSVKFRFGLEQKRVTLGVYPRLSLATAREKAIDLLRQADEGIDPTKRRRRPDMKVETVCREFIRLYAQTRNKSWREAERILEQEFISAHGPRDIREIKRYDILELMDAAIERGAGYQANRILSHIRKLFNWCIERGILEASPIAGVKPPTKEVSRERVLNDDELVRILRACRNEVYPFRQIVPMLLATAQRRGELTEMRWSEIDLEEKLWVIPAERAKNGKKHYVPLSTFALEILNEVPRFLDCDYVFTTTRQTPVSGYSKWLRRLSAESETSDWRYHDLRRTAATNLAKLGVTQAVTEKILNHVSGIVSGVAAVYNRHNYADEMREALEMWGQRLAELSPIV